MGRSKGCSSHPPSPQPFPWLTFSHGKFSNIQTFYSIPDDRYYRRKLPDLSNKLFCGSCEGWLVTLDGRAQCDDCFLINLASMEKILLPPLKDFYPHKCILTAPPTESNCVVAFLDEAFVMFWRPNKENWIKQRYGSQGDELRQVVVCGRKIYGLVRGNHLAVLEIVDDKVELKLIGPKETPEVPPGVVCFHRRLVESCGEIFFVQLPMLGESSSRIEDIEVYKLDNINVEWLKVDDIGDRVFFLDASFSTLSCSAVKSGLKRNSIYFTSCSAIEKDRNLYLFDLKEHRIHSSLPCPNVVYRRRNTCWIMIPPTP